MSNKSNLSTSPSPSVTERSAQILSEADEWLESCCGNAEPPPVCNDDHELCFACEVVTKLKAHVETLSESLQPHWQPIETAPKDGTPVRLKWVGTTVEATGRWVLGNNLRYAEPNWRDVEGDDLLLSPTHWASAPSVEKT